VIDGFCLVRPQSSFGHEIFDDVGKWLGERGKPRTAFWRTFDVHDAWVGAERGHECVEG
jgi:hypothetical protein